MGGGCGRSQWAVRGRRRRRASRYLRSKRAAEQPRRGRAPNPPPPRPCRRACAPPRSLRCPDGAVGAPPAPLLVSGGRLISWPSPTTSLCVARRSRDQTAHPLSESRPSPRPPAQAIAAGDWLLGVDGAPVDGMSVQVRTSPTTCHVGTGAYEHNMSGPDAPPPPRRPAPSTPIPPRALTRGCGPGRRGPPTRPGR